MSNTVSTLLTTEDLARELNLSVRTLETWRCKKRGPRFIRTGRGIRYRPTDVGQWLEENASA